MKLAWITLIALAGGFVAGLLLSEVIGIVGFVVLRQAVGIKYLPVYLALLSAGVALVVALVSRRKLG